MNNNLIEIQEILLRQMKRLDEIDNKIGGNTQEEISKANALSENATAFIKSVNVGLRIIEVSEKYGIKKDINKELGVYSEK